MKDRLNALAFPLIIALILTVLGAFAFFSVLDGHVGGPVPRLAGYLITPGLIVFVFTHSLHEDNSGSFWQIPAFTFTFYFFVAYWVRKWMRHMQRPR